MAQGQVILLLTDRHQLHALTHEPCLKWLLCTQALKQSTGLQRQQYESWRRTLLQCLANVEAVIDFGEDEGIAEEVAEQVLPRVQRLGQQLRQHLVSGELCLTCSLLFKLASSCVITPVIHALLLNHRPRLC